MKAAVGTTRTHNPFGEVLRASCLRENLTSSSYGEGLETGRAIAQAPRQALTRQLFFKWIKGHLRIKSFYGTSANAVKTQIWVAVIVYLLVAIAKKRLKLHISLHTLLQILEVNLFEKIDIIQLVTKALRQENETEIANQLNLFGS